MAIGTKKTMDVIKAKESNPGIISETSSTAPLKIRGKKIGDNITSTTIISIIPMTNTTQRVVYFSLLISIHSHSLWN